MKQMMKQKGMTLIEISIVLVIMAIIIGGALYGMSYVNKQKANSESAAYLRAIQNIQEKYRGQANTAALTTANAVAGNVFDNGFNVNTVAGTVTNSYDGAVTVAPGTVTVANDGITLTSTSINDIGCEKIPLMLDSIANKITITGSAAVIVKATAAAVMTPAAIDAACNNDNNTIAIVTSKNGR